MILIIRKKGQEPYKVVGNWQEGEKPVVAEDEEYYFVVPRWVEKDIEYFEARIPVWAAINDMPKEITLDYIETAPYLMQKGEMDFVWEIILRRVIHQKFKQEYPNGFDCCTLVGDAYNRSNKAIYAFYIAVVNAIAYPDWKRYTNWKDDGEDVLTEDKMRAFLIEAFTCNNIIVFCASNFCVSNR